MEYQNFLKSSDADITKVSKIMVQYLTIKRQNPDSIIFFRLGDFYETYFEDAYILSKVCSVLLTKRKFAEPGEVLMAGVPYHSAEIYIAKLVKEKYKISIVEQVQDKKEVKKGDIIKREVIRTYSPGTLIEEEFLESKKNNFIASLLKSPKNSHTYGFSYADISTGEFFITEGTLDEILCELSKVNPSETLAPMKVQEVEPFKTVPEKEADIDKIIVEKYPITLIKPGFYSDKNEDIGLCEYALGLKCANAIINYAKDTQKKFMPKLDKIKKYSISSRLIMNSKTRQNLELNRVLGDDKKYGSIFWALDNCKTFMGKRLLALWLNEPLIKVSEIEERLDGTEELTKNPDKLKLLRDLNSEIEDTARLSSKLSNGTISPKELLGIKTSLKTIEEFSKLCLTFNSKILKKMPETSLLTDFRSIIERTVKDEPSNNIRVGNIIKEGANGVLDTIKADISSLEDELKTYEEDLISLTGIKNLKINYAKNTGYSIDVPVLGTKSFRENVGEYSVKQKLTSYEKLTTPRLLKIEEKILSLKMKANELEYDTFLKLREYAKEVTDALRDFSSEVAIKDVLSSFAEDALKYGFCRPKFLNGTKYQIKEGAHPVLMRLSTSSNHPPDRLDVDFNDLEKCLILTGANMSGKSTYLKQSAALIILAQSGSFVPCKAFEAGIVDKIFLRTGTKDDLINNNSAFMCEMLDVAEILRNSTPKSLILLDETGNSTSYKDGISVSYGIIKYTQEKIGAKTLLATHFHALNILEKELKTAVNYRLILDEKDGIPKRRLEKGFLTSSMGLNAAAKAGLPPYVIECARKFQEISV